jgi:hypothetical protein
MRRRSIYHSTIVVGEHHQPHGSDLEKDYAPNTGDHALEEEGEELAGMQQEDLEEHMVMEEPISSARREEEVENLVVENSFKTLREEWPRA